MWAKTVRETELRIVRNRETKENFKIWNFGLVAVRDEEVEDPSRYATDLKYLKSSGFLRDTRLMSRMKCKTLDRGRGGNVVLPAAVGQNLSTAVKGAAFAYDV
ncbi:hypothetical protein E3N88_09334 [Mikania micrantha]|uniref:Uncharacterized protein n=1 Tax=Mikania micrantha TaxID=192012 RepID=A0A5N6PJN5_9ASTR|nr:hypothetical protein E3N88_09334 [Mikania micrantha]